MSHDSRNSRFTRKSGKKRPNTGDSPTGDSPSHKRAYGMRSHGATTQPKSPKNKPPRPARAGSGREGGSGWLYGAHACNAALANSRRTIHEILLTEQSQTRYSLPKGTIPPKIVLPNVLDKVVGRNSVHQGIAVKAAPLEWPDLEDIADKQEDGGLILVLDQITDPQNVGAMLRLCSAFDVKALVMQTRKAPPLSGALAKVAVGCLETIPVCLETNIANTLQNLQRLGWIVTGLAGETELELKDAVSGGGKHVIVMGAEGPGLRERVRKTCDQLAKIPMMSEHVIGQAESLNVATAAAIALYEVRRG